jgi:hypothetical protein
MNAVPPLSTVVPALTKSGTSYCCINATTVTEPAITVIVVGDDH